MPKHNWVRALDKVGCSWSKKTNNFSEWLDLHANRIGPAKAGVLLYCENGHSGAGRQHISGGRLGRTAYLLGHLRTRTNAITDRGGFCVHRCFDFSDRVRTCGTSTPSPKGRPGSGEGEGKVENARMGSLSLGRRGDNDHECLRSGVILMLLPNAYQAGSHSGYEEELKKVCFPKPRTLLLTKGAWHTKAGNACP
ncbi:hypothetical protein K438DRAFT_1789667 [Mycena galopus ATCC 62051]|nr:hypothetical protein K438DRAFT_1789667 [Mycena galopus ATCC 62051]